MILGSNGRWGVDSVDSVWGVTVDGVVDSVDSVLGVTVCRLFRAGDFTDHIQVILSVLVACMCQESPNTFRKGFWIGIEEFRMSGTNQKCS